MILGSLRRGANLPWKELRSEAIRDLLKSASPFLEEHKGLTKAFLRNDPIIHSHLEGLIDNARWKVGNSTSLDTSCKNRAHLASLLDLSGAHNEALIVLDSVDGKLPPAAVFLREIIERHMSFEKTRLERLEGVARMSKFPVEVLDASSVSPAEVALRFIAPGIPCVLRGATKVPQWTPDDLCARLGSRLVPLRRCVDSSVDWARLEFAGSAPFGEFVTTHVLQHEHTGSDKDTPQLFDYSIWQHCTDVLADEVFMPKWFCVDLFSQASSRVQPVSGSASPTLFLAAHGTSSSLHVDFLQTHFWMGLCHGRKRWRLLPREDLALLYPKFLTDLNPSFPIDLNEAMDPVDCCKLREQFPTLSYLSTFEIELEPGDVIFVPRGWPHQVDNLETSVAISANFIDTSNLSWAKREAELLGLIHEDPGHLAAALKEAESCGVVDRLVETIPNEHLSLKDFKARHGESRTPQEIQRLLTRGLQTTFVLLGVSGFIVAWYRGFRVLPISKVDA